MLANGLVLGGRFRVIRNFAPAASSIAVAEDLHSAELHWLVQFAASASEAQLTEAIERHGRFALGVPGLARPVAWGVEGEVVFLAFKAAGSGNLVDGLPAPWPVARVAALATRIAAALAPLHEQGIAYGCLLPELVAEADSGPVLFGFGVAAVAGAFGAPGEASQLLPPAYRAPELRASLLAPSPASDLFAFAVLLRQLLLPASTPVDSALAPSDLSADLQALFTRATAPAPRARPHDIRAFATEFANLSLAPAPAPVPVPVPALGNVPVPVPVPALGNVPVPAPTPALPPSSSRNAFIALFAVIAGLLLMMGGVIGAFVYASRHARSSPTIAHTPPVRPRPVAPTPTPPAPAETDPTLAPETAPEAAAEAEPTPKSPPHSHAPMVAPGVGPSSFPDEARVALPVLGSEPIWGTRNASLTWVFFGDLECPHTRRAWRALEAAKAGFGDDLRIIFRHRPLREHDNALQAARVLAGLARRQGAQAFFDVLHRVAQGDESLTPERLSAQLEASGYGAQKISDLAAAGEGDVLTDLQLAGQFAVKSTPFSFLNGQPIDGERSAEELEQLLRAEQRSATWIVASGVQASALYATRTSSNLIGVGEAAETRVCAPVAKSPMVGPADALVTLVEFADFECQFCKRVEPTLKTLLTRYPKTLRLVWKDYPLPQHKHANLLANFVADAHRRGSNLGFWTVHVGVFAESDALDDGALGKLAGKAGLDGALLLIAAHAGVHDAAIRADMRLGQRLGVNGTPTFFANGRRVQGALSLEQFETVIQAELKTAQRIVARGVPARDVYRLVCD